MHNHSTSAVINFTLPESNKKSISGRFVRSLLIDKPPQLIIPGSCCVFNGFNLIQSNPIQCHTAHASGMCRASGAVLRTFYWCSLCNCLLPAVASKACWPRPKDQVSKACWPRPKDQRLSVKSTVGSRGARVPGNTSDAVCPRLVRILAKKNIWGSKQP